MSDDWRVWRPAIWLAMIGCAVMLLFSPWYFGAIFLGAAIGAAIRIRQRLRRAQAAAATAASGSKKRPRPGSGRS